MSTPASPIPRRFYRVAYQRLEEAEVLFDAGYYVGSVYLAGYAVECMLKTLILNSLPEKDHETVANEFRGQHAHNYEWLRNRYAQTNAPGLPVEISESLAFVSTWETALRYTPGLGNPDDAARFLRAVQQILAWGDNRIGTEVVNMVTILGEPDGAVQQVASVLEAFEKAHEDSQCFVRRYNPASIRVKIVDAVFDGKSKGERHDYAMQFLRALPDDVAAQISILLCLVPGESSLLDLEFQDPSRSML